MYELPLPQNLVIERWKVKIWNKEIREPPHLTIICKTQIWRWGLREREFMDTKPDPSLVPQQVMDEIHRQYVLLCNEWDRMYPNNPNVGPEENKDA